jgi:ABC-type transport system substrate-binding protein
VWCKNRPPLDDVRVRRALGHATDREEINQFLYEGEGEISWGLFPEDHPWHDKRQVGKIDHDPAEAKRLLAEAGYPNGFDLGMYIVPGDPQRAAEVVQGQWAEVGVNVTLHTTTNALTDFYQQAKELVLAQNDSGPVNIVRQYSQASIANVCNYDDPTYVSALRKLNTLPYGSDEYVEQFHIIDDLSNEQMVRFPLILPPRSAIYSDQVGGVRLIDGPLGSPRVDFYAIYKKK